MAKRRNRAIFESDDDDDDVEEKEDVTAFAIGDPIKFSVIGGMKKRHYASFKINGTIYEIGTSVFLAPEKVCEKPYIAIIKDITDSGQGIMISGQWFYRPEEAIKKDGTTWQSRDDREIYYSLHVDEVAAESIMHECNVHFIPLNKKVPKRSEKPGFIVQKVYKLDKMLWDLIDERHDPYFQNELNEYVKKTMVNLGEFPCIEPEEKSTIAAIVSPQGYSRAEFPDSFPNNASKYYAILRKFDALTGGTSRDKWHEKLLQGIEQACIECSLNHHANACEKICWPDTAVEAVLALEKACHGTLGLFFQKYKEKMRQLEFNLKNTASFARHLLKKELDPAVIINMSPSELKNRVTAADRAVEGPNVSECMQMTDARCSRCQEKRVAITDIIHTGGCGNRYQLECQQCAYSWYASTDDISLMTIQMPNATGNVGIH